MKCQKAGRQCSGYDDAKPLQWIQPGKVTSRRRRKKDGSSPKTYTIEPTANSETRTCQDANVPEQKLCKPMHEEDYICEPVDYEAALSSWEKDRVSHPGDRITDLHALSFKMTASAREAGRIFQIGGRAKIEEIVESGSHEEAAKLLRSDRNPLQRLKRLLEVLQLQDVPRYGDLMDETSEVVQAVQYYMTITTILMFMCLELQNPSFADWRSHVNGMKRIVDLRGGPKKLMKEAPHLVPSLVLYLLIVSVANTCSPSWDQVEINSTADDVTEDITSIYSLIFPYTLCPPELFTEMLHINRLRAKASAAVLQCDFDVDHTLKAYDLLARIEAFSVEDWAQPGTFYDEWLIVGTVYKSALALYAILSLGSLTVLPADASLLDIQTVHGDTLLSNLRTALKDPRIARFMAWPLVVVGVEAIYRGEATRDWIGASLEELSRTLGTSGPIKACSVLRRYWKGGVSGWDECFDRPYVFVI
ncbi:unnamed protein product [Alternaria alternata]